VEIHFASTDLYIEVEVDVDVDVDVEVEVEVGVPLREDVRDLKLVLAEVLDAASSGW